VEPLFWYRPRSDGGYDGPLHNDQIEEVRKKSGAWVPLHAGSKPEPVQYAKDSVHFTNNDVKELAAELAEILPKYFYPVQWGNSIMEKAKEFASAWSLVGGRFDDGTALAHAEQIKSELRAMVCAHPQPAQEPVQGEPVCYADFDENGVIECTQNNPKGLLQAVPLYTQPQPAPLVRLTDEEIEKLVHPHYKSTESFVAGINFDLKIAHAIMDAMQKKNGGAAMQAKAQPATDICTRSHPHEKMDAMCELRTEIARLMNRLVRAESSLAELVEALEETQRDLTVLLGNIFASSKRDKNWEGMYDVVNGWIARNHAALAKHGGES
jgi:hypothetical protein